MITKAENNPKSKECKRAEYKSSKPNKKKNNTKYKLRAKIKPVTTRAKKYEARNKNLKTNHRETLKIRRGGKTQDELTKTRGGYKCLPLSPADV